ncbi:MAG: M14 family metallopeptidase [Gemmatimonadetes bacterium]|nr:M14 family metallopeptidase [Gemmatimonadota bacterium]
MNKSLLTPARALTAVCLLVLAAAPVNAQRITTPQEEFGFNIGDDYRLANYTQFETYWRKLAQESSRMVLREIGRTAEGRPQLMAILTSPENHANLDRYQEIARRLALAEGLTDEAARALANEGKAVIWIDGGLHATEVLGAHQLMELVYQMVSRTDDETMRFLDDIILLAAHANPDGMQLVSDWYMRNPVPEDRSTRGIPVLYQKYVGHDNNRDFYMSAQPESESINRILYREWFPQIVYNHHQTGPAGTVMFAPPFRDPFNYNYDPLVPLGIEMVGAAMHSRFIAEGKPGTTMRSGASYSTWWNGGLRTTPYFHNMIGLLTETIGNPTPVEIPFILDRQLPHNDLAAPIEPQRWHFRQSIEYSQTANRAVLDYASRYREPLLYNIYRMGMNSIERGGRDNWTVHPKILDAVAAAAASAGDTGDQGGRGGARLPIEYFEMMRDPALRDARAYILPSMQPDFPTVTKFVNTLIKNGVAVHRATRDFAVGGKQYAGGSYVVMAAQAFRPHVLDMFEPQDHPNDFAYPGGPPIAPYDNTGWTLAYQMGVEFDRVLEGFDGPFEKIEGFADVAPGMVTAATGATGFLVSHGVNDAFVATNRLLADGKEVYWLTQPMTAAGTTWPAGTIYIPASSGVQSDIEAMASELGVSFAGVTAGPTSDAMRMRPVRVGLWDQYGGSMPSGWARWILEQFEFPFEVVFPGTFNAGNLRDRFDVLVFVSGAIPGVNRGDGRGGFRGDGPDPASIPQEFRDRLGRVTVEETVPHLREFLEAGGHVVTIGSSAALGYHLGLPLTDHKVDENGSPLTREDHFIPGSILRMRVDTSRPVSFGIGDEVDVHFNHSPVFDLGADAAAMGVRPVAWFDRADPLRSGWAWGQESLENGVTVVEADVGRGKLYLFGPEILRRAQPHGTFKFLFNAIYLAGAESRPMGEGALER